MKYQKPYVISGPKKPYIVPDVSRRPSLAQQVVKTVYKAGSESEQKDSSKRVKNDELPSVYHNCPL